MSEVGDSKGGNGEVPENAQDLTIFVQNLLEQMVRTVIFSSASPDLSSSDEYFFLTQQQRFNQMSTSIIGRIDEMGNRIDDLEKSIGDLMQQVRNHSGVCIVFVVHEVAQFHCFFYAYCMVCWEMVRHLQVRCTVLTNFSSFMDSFCVQAGVDPKGSLEDDK